MQTKPSNYWKTVLLLPFILGACGGNQHTHSQVTAENQITPQPNSEVTETSTQQENSASENSETEPTTVHNTQNETITKADTTSANISVPPHHTSVGSVSDSNRARVTTSADSDTSTTQDQAHQETDFLIKAPITPELIEKVKQAKTATDSTGLPNDYRAEYVVITPSGEMTLTLKAPENSAEPYYLNSSIFPQGESLGTMRSQLGGKPHTEESFMSYQQFYSGITGSRKHVVYFDDEAIQRDEPFYIDLPTGLVSKESDLPIAGVAHYIGKAIDGNRFGDFNYHVDFKEKMGMGGSIIWNKNDSGNFGDIVLQPGRITAQALSVAVNPELFPEEYSHRGPGITGIAAISGEENKKFTYKGVFFGPRAEEFSGLIYEQNDSSAHGISDDIEQKNIISFAGVR